MIKKTLDRFISLFVIIAGLPLIVIVLLLDFLFTWQFPIVIQERFISPKKGKIKILKIRTIISKPELSNLQNKGGILRNEEYIKYVPAFCRWLRKSGIDEILQVLNVLKGEMSLVGPRPLLLREFNLIKEESPQLYSKREKLNSLPGITGYWQVFGEREKGVRNLIELDEYYEKNKSMSLDIQIIIKTFWVMLTATHSDAIISRRERIKTTKYFLTLDI